MSPMRMLSSIKKLVIIGKLTWFQVSVHDVDAVHVVERLENGPHYQGAFFVSKRVVGSFFPFDVISEWPCSHQLHPQEDLAFDFSDLKERIKCERNLHV
jgi:hypothetical protein